MSNVREFPRKFDASKPGEFVEGYSRVIRDLTPEELPDNIIVIELWHKNGEMDYNTWIGGPDMNAVAFAGSLELIKHAALTNNFFQDVGE